MALTSELVGEVEQGWETAGPEHFASLVFAGAPDVFSTPALGALIERTAASWLARNIDDGQMSVGTQIVINHTGATPPGLVVEVQTKVVGVDGRRVDFEWTASDGVEQVGNGTHQRFVVDSERFMSRLATKRA